MFHLLNHLRKGKVNEKGQGLVEYALILVLTTIVVIVMLVVFGQKVKAEYCKVVFSLDPNLDPPACDALEVNCVVTGTPPGVIRWEGVVNDTMGPNNVSYVQFYVDGNLFNTEGIYRYCFNGGDSSCTPYPSSQFGSGTHRLTAIAYDADGNTGRCTTTLTIP
jgi:Flp pilus assembly pilin Flp